MPTMLKGDNTQNLKKLILKWGEIPISNKYLNGVVKIVGYRKYSVSSEVDIVFEGKIFVKIHHSFISEWFDKSIHTKHNISKVKLNRFLRKNCLQEIKNRLNYFDISLHHYSEIKKINWK